MTDILLHGKHPFPMDLEEILIRVHRLEPRLIEFLPLEKWEEGIGLDTAIAQCQEMLDRYPAEGWTFLGELPFRKQEPDKS